MITFYSLNDLFFFPLYALIFLLIIRKYARLYTDRYISQTLIRAFGFRVLFCILFFVILQFYYGYGDSSGYYLIIQDLHNMDWPLKKEFLTSPNKVAEINTELFYAFTSNLGYTMNNLSNATLVKIGYWVSSICGSSFLAICLFFSSFAFWGAWKLYQLFLHYYPDLKREFALAILYLPSVCFWSSGFLKDSLTFGAACLLINSLHNILILKRKVLTSVLVGVLSSYLLLYIKVYILLALIPGLVVWLFLKFDFTVLHPNTRKLVMVLFFMIGVGLGFFLLRYIGSTTYAKELSTENVSEKIYGMRDTYGTNEITKGGSYFEISTENIFLSFPLGIVASLYRPFPWEVKSFTMFFSSIEAFAFLVLTLFLLFKVGIFHFFRNIFSSPDTIFFFVFSFIFAGSVGSSTPNFGSLVRYKIPCLPFYLMLLFLIFYRNKLSYPRWLNWILGKKRNIIAVPKMSSI